MELEVTWKRTLRIWWSYLWRNLIAIVCAGVLGGIIGAMIGFVMGTMGAEIETIQMVVAPISAVLGLLISIVPMKLILGKDFGEFRLVLIQNEQIPNT